MISLPQNSGMLRSFDELYLRSFKIVILDKTVYLQRPHDVPGLILLTRHQKLVDEGALLLLRLLSFCPGNLQEGSAQEQKESLKGPPNGILVGTLSSNLQKQ